MSADRDDELMAVLLGEPPSGRDEDAGERHAAAARDMDAVHAQLRWIGDGLARDAGGSVQGDGSARDAAGPAPRERAPAAGPVRRRLFLLAASVAVALLGTGTAYLVAHNGAADGGAEASLTYEGLIACSGAVVEGTVERVEPAGGDDRYRIVLDVDRHYKPADGGRHLAFTDEGANVPAYYRTGVRMLVLVPEAAGEGPESYREGDPPTPEHGLGPAVRDALQEGRLRVERALPGARGLTCDGAG
jgi:hypothetical protein